MHGELGGAQLAQQAAELSSRDPLLNRMQNIQIKGKKSTIRLNFGSLEEKKSGKEEESPRPAKKPKKADGKHVNAPAAMSGNELN